jgi:alkyl hydroperoxide reductase subunit AhpC
VPDSVTILQNHGIQPSAQRVAVADYVLQTVEHPSVDLVWSSSTPAFATQLGILHPQAGAALRVTYIVDPDGIIRWANANDLSVGRNVDEVIRALDALQSDELCPCNWRPGQQTLGAA